MTYFDRQNLIIPQEVANMIRNIKILIIGLGAAGNEMAKNLVLMGFRNITGIDFDTVEDSNLSRTVLFSKEDIGQSKAIAAAKRLNEMALADKSHVTGLHGNIMTDFGKGQLFLEHDIVISCVDTQKCRAFINDWCVRTNTPLFEIGFEGFNTNVTFFAPENGYTQVTDGKEIDKLPSDDGYFPIPKNNMKVCLREIIGQGTFDEKRNSCSGFKAKDTELAKIPTLQSASAMAGAIVTTELIKYLMGKDSLRNKMLCYYGLTHGINIFEIPRSKKCTIHEENILIETLEADRTNNIGDILKSIRNKWNATPIIQVPPFIFYGHCTCCNKVITINKRESDVYDEERWCKECRDEYEDYQERQFYPNQWKQTINEISLSSEKEILDLKLEDIGIPTDDILKVILVDESSYRHIYLRFNPSDNG